MFTFEDKSNLNSYMTIKDSSEEMLFTINLTNGRGRFVSVDCLLDRGQVFELARSLQEWLNLNDESVA